MPTVHAAPRRQIDRREEAESKFIEAAIHLITTKGFGGFSLTDVANEAGYSRGLPRHYFGSKEGLLAKVASYVMQGYANGIAEPRSATSEVGLPRLATMVRHYGRGIRSPGSQALGILATHSIVEPLLRKAVATLNATGLRAIEKEIKAGVAAGNIRPDADAGSQARIIYSFLRGQMVFAVLDPTYDPKAVSEAFIAGLQASIGS